MFDWLRKRRLSSEGRKKLLIVTARAEEALIDTHVANILAVLEAIGDEVEVDRAVELYLERVPIPESLATAVTTRLLAQLEEPAPRAGGRQNPYRQVFRDRGRR